MYQKYSSAILAIALLFPFRGICETSAKNWSLAVSIREADLTLGEPLALSCVLKNIGKDVQYVQIHPSYRKVFISDGATPYKIYEAYDRKIIPSVTTILSVLNKCACFAGFPSEDDLKCAYFKGVEYRIPKLKPGESETYPEFILFDRTRVVDGKRPESCLAFPTAGTFQVKVRYEDELGFAEDQITVKVHEPIGQDAEAWKIYNHQDTFKYVQYQGDPFGLDESEEARLKGAEIKIQKILKDYSGTAYAKTIKRLPRYEEKGPTQPEPRDILDQTLKELESAFYDVTGFGKDHPKENNEYCQKLVELADQYDPENKEFWQRSAELLKSYIKKYSKPLPPEEWKRRYAKYAEEEKTKAMQERKEKEEYERKYGALTQAHVKALGYGKSEDKYLQIYQEELRKIIAETRDEEVKKKAQEHMEATEKRLKEWVFRDLCG